MLGMRCSAYQDGLCPSLCSPVDRVRAVINDECLCRPDADIGEETHIVLWPFLESVDQVGTVQTAKAVPHAQAIKITSQFK